MESAKCGYLALQGPARRAGQLHPDCLLLWIDPPEMRGPSPDRERRGIHSWCRDRSCRSPEFHDDRVAWACRFATFHLVEFLAHAPSDISGSPFANTGHLEPDFVLNRVSVDVPSKPVVEAGTVSRPALVTT